MRLNDWSVVESPSADIPEDSSGSKNKNNEDGGVVHCVGGDGADGG